MVRLLPFWLMLLVGVRDYQPYVGEATGLTAASGFERGDLILSIDERPVSTWTHVLVDLTTRAYRGQTVAVEVRSADGHSATRTLDLGKLGEPVDEERFLKQLGLQPWHWVPPSVVDTLREGDPAQAAGVHAGDRVLKVGGKDVDRFKAMSDAIQAEAAANGGKVHLLVERNGIQESITVPARLDPRDGKPFWVIGVTPDMRETLRHYGPIDAVPQAFAETWRLTTGSVRVICAYVPNGQAVGSDKYTYKLAWLAGLRRWLDRHDRCLRLRLAHLRGCWRDDCLWHHKSGP